MIRNQIGTGIRIGLTFAFCAFAIGLSHRTALAQAQAPDVVVRIDQLERQLRQLTGAIEQLQFRNQQLEQQVRQLQDGADPRAPDSARSGTRTMPARPSTLPAPVGSTVAPPPPPASSSAAPPPPAPPGTRRLDVFDPELNPNAPGAPRPLSGPGRRSDAIDPRGAQANTAIMNEEPQVGLPGGREPGAPLDLSTLASAAAADPRLGAQRPDPIARAPAQGSAAPAPVAAAAAPPPSAPSPRDEFDLAYGYLLRKDYAHAEQGLRAFTDKYPGDPLVGDARYWLAESLFQRQDYRPAAEAFVFMSKKYEKHPKAPDALLRLGQSLAALNERELACATYSEVSRKYPRASSNVKQLVEREQKRARC